MVNRPTFWAFETAKRAISNSQFGLDTVGHNLANAETPGYTRQRVDQVSFNVRGMSKYAVNNQFFTGLGARTTGVSQIRDPYLDARYRQESTDYGKYVIHQNGLQDLTQLFDEYKTEAGLTIAMNELIEAIRVATSNPTDEAYAIVVRTKAAQFTQLLNQYAGRVEDIKTENTKELTSSIKDMLNPMLAEVASLNDQIIKMEIYGNPANELRDRRNMLLDEISMYVDIEISETHQRVTPDVTITHLQVNLKGSQDAFGKPYVLIKEDKYAQFYAGSDKEGNIAIQLSEMYNAKGWTEFPNWDTRDNVEFGFDPTLPKLHSEFTSFVDGSNTSDLKNGALKGYMDLLRGDGLGGNFRGFLYAENYLNTLANVFADVMNSVNKSHVQEINRELILESGFAAYLTDHITGKFKLDINGDPIFFTVDHNDPSGFKNAVGLFEYTKTGGDKAFIVDGNGDEVVFRWDPDAKDYIDTQNPDRSIYYYFALDENSDRLPTTSGNGGFVVTGADVFKIDPNDPYFAGTFGSALIINSQNAEVWFPPKEFLYYHEDTDKYYTLKELAWQTPPEAKKDASGEPVKYMVRSINPDGTGVPLWSAPGIATAYDPDNRLHHNIVKYDRDDPMHKTGILKQATTGITAANIAISEEWRFDSKAALLSRPGNINADTNYAASFLDALEKMTYNILPEEKSMTFHEVIVGFQAILALDKNLSNNLQTTSNRILNTIEDQRQAVSGVSENEEAIDMMRYSNHYNAAVRYMTALDEALDVVINGMGRVGR